MTTITHNPQIVRDVDAEAYRRQRRAALRTALRRIPTVVTCDTCGEPVPYRDARAVDVATARRWRCVWCIDRKTRP
jgi:hypothetical protein